MRHALIVEVEVLSTVEVYDALGRRVASGSGAPGVPLRLDVRAWPAGLYVARASGPGGSASAQILVAR